MLGMGNISRGISQKVVSSFFTTSGKRQKTHRAINITYVTCYLLVPVICVCMNYVKEISATLNFELSLGNQH